MFHLDNVANCESILQYATRDGKMQYKNFTNLDEEHSAVTLRIPILLLRPTIDMGKYLAPSFPSLPSFNLFKLFL